MSENNSQDRVRELEGEVARLRGLLQAAEANKREAVMRFAAGFSHDMNNFLTPVLAYGAMIKEDLTPGHPAIEYAQEIVDAAEKTQHLIKTMQDVRAKGNFSGAFALNEAVAAAVAEFKPQVPATVHFSTGLDPSAGDVRGDGFALRRALHAMLENGVQSMPVGGDLEVKTATAQLEQNTEMDGETAPAGRYLIVSIRDQGMGIADDVRPHMYEPYFTKRPQGQAKGLGLAIANGLVRKCGGFIRCTSAFGAGTTFEIFLRPVS